MLVADKILGVFMRPMTWLIIVLGAIVYIVYIIFILMRRQKEK